MTQVYQTIKAKDYNEERTIEYLTEFIDEIDNVKADVSEQRRVFIRNKRLRTFDSNFKIYSWQYYLKRYISNSKNFNVK